MGADLSCPAGFEDRVFFSCSAACPAEFKKLRDQQQDECIHITRNNRGFALRTMPKQRGAQQGKPAPPEPAFYEEERVRVRNEAARIRRQVEEDIQRTRELNAARDSRQGHVNRYSKIQSDQAIFTSMAGAAREVRAIKDSLRRFRPPTAPSSDLEIERKAISDIATRNLFLVQVALACVVVALASYLILPIGYAHGVAFLTLCVGIAVGFFLRRE
jgi:hypothetical protein